jgi:cysteinyl-tRNA synthetase
MLKIHNTLTRTLEVFEPMHPPFVGMYVCGPTVYDEPHLGHAKSYVAFDVIVRFLRASGYRVRYVQNITDVGHLVNDAETGEDRIERRAKLEQLEPVEIAQKYETAYFRAMDRLHCLRPDISCRATGHIPEMLELVERLVERGLAYEAQGNVYFDIARFPDYGKLSGKKLDDLKEGVRIDTAEGKRHPFDFALWKKAEAGHLMQWRSPWGMGFPGWHLECSAMSMKYLGEGFDIHGGGLDNQFPHHECEIAQSEGSTGRPFVKYWIHNNMVTVNGQKMGKSLGNFVTLTDLFSRFDPMTVRFFILQGHYRSPQDFSDTALEAAQKGFERLSRVVSALNEAVPDSEMDAPDSWNVYRARFIEFMEDDFNTAGAVSVLFEMGRDVHDRITSGSKDGLASAKALFSELAGDVLGLRFDSVTSAGWSVEAELIDLLLKLRQTFREGKDWKSADEIRDGLAEMNISIEDGKDGAKWRKTSG